MPRPQVYDAGHVAGLATLREAAHAALPLPRGRRRELPAHRDCRSCATSRSLYPADRAAAAHDDEFLFGPDLLAAPVLAPRAAAQAVYAAARDVGRLLGLGRVRARRSGGLGRRRARLLAGGRRGTLAAPVGRLPLLARAGAVVPLLPADVDTLARTRAPGVVAASPTGATSSCSPFRAGAAPASASTAACARARAAAAGRSPSRPAGAAFTVQAGLSALRRPFRPRTVLLDGRPLPSRWRFDARRGVLRATVRLGRRASSPCAASRPARGDHASSRRRWALT